ncbi:MAG: TusE/DsrC/DsvC family sulfur relay protein [Terracoccus sp.]
MTTTLHTTTIAGHEVDVNEEGFLTRPDQWSEDLGRELARLIGVELTDEHWTLIRFLRDDFAAEGETATLRRVSTRTGIPIKSLFTLFPGKPAKKMAYVAGLPKPKGCV